LEGAVGHENKLLRTAVAILADYEYYRLF